MLNSANTFDDSPSHGHGAFLHRAALDPRFRTALEADPQAALAEYGLSVDLEQIPSRVTLPSAENILGSLAAADAESTDPNDPVRMPWQWLI